jgi:hypothetical protein
VCAVVRRFFPFLLSSLLVFCQGSWAQSSNDQPGVTFDVGAGWDQLFNDGFQAFLSANSLTPIDPLRTWRTDWRWIFEFDPLYFGVGSSRMLNYFFGPYGDVGRARLVWDSTRFTVGFLIIRVPEVEWMIGGSVVVSTFILQAYGNDMGDFPTVFGGGGNAGLVSDWNWSPEAETVFGIRISPQDEFTFWLRAGIQGGWLPLQAVWKLYGDPEVSGVPNPFTFYIRYAVWVGIEIR